MSVWTLLILLGIVQGLTEFLPVSSDGHLALAQMLFGLGAPSLAITVLLHAGTFAATLIYFRRQVMRILSEGWRAIRSPRSLPELAGAKDALTVVVASVPTAIIGLSLRSAVERWTQLPEVVGIGFLVTAGLLLSTSRALFKRRESPEPAAAVEIPIRFALLLGVAQGLAVAPGVSRSGSTIAVALWLGIKPERAFDLSMLLSLPAVAGAILLEAPHVREVGVTPLALALGACVAFVVGLCALALLRRVVIAGRLWWFAVWVVTVAVATFALARAWPET